MNFRLLFESAPALFLVLDTDLVIVAASDAYLRATMTTREGIVGRHILEAFPDNPDDAAATGTVNVNASLQRVLKHRVPDTLAVQKYDVERAPDAGGGFETRYWSPSHTPVVGPDGQVIYIVQQVEDVTALVTLQEDGDDARQQTDDLRERTRQMQGDIMRRSQELQDANQLLRAADNAKNDFLSRVSHELRTPLNAILGFSELLCLGEISQEHHEWAGLIHDAGRHLLGLLDDVLDIARIEGGHLRLVDESIAVGPLIGEVLELVRPIADAAAVRLTPLPDIPADLCAAADRQRLRQVLINLLSNAIKFNHPTGTVSVTARQQPGEQLRIDVVDTGRGMAPESLTNLFNPFERLDAAKAGFEGTGLGLSLSRHLVTSMRGRLEVASTLGQGSTFWIELPTAPAVSVVAGPDHSIPAPPSETRPTRVLYVEDVAENARLVRDILAHRPAITLVIAPRAAVALDLARQLHVDLILLDLHLPDMPGEELLALLRAEPGTGDAPVVALSADTTAHRLDRLRSAGVAAYLTKPVAVADLLLTLDRLLPTAARAPTETTQLSNGAPERW